MYHTHSNITLILSFHKHSLSDNLKRYNTIHDSISDNLGANFVKHSQDILPHIWNSKDTWKQPPIDYLQIDQIQTLGYQLNPKEKKSSTFTGIYLYWLCKSYITEQQKRYITTFSRAFFRLGLDLFWLCWFFCVLSFLFLLQFNVLPLWSPPLVSLLLFPEETIKCQN